MGNMGSLFVSSGKGKKIPMYSLKTIVEEYKIENAVLKMDCEGCEYNLLNEDDETLKKFNRIVLEFHYGYKNIDYKLRNTGFSTKAFIVSKRGGNDPRLKSMALNNRDYTYGLLYAKLI